MKQYREKKEERFSFSIEEPDPPPHITPFTPQLDSESCRILGGMVARTHTVAKEESRGDEEVFEVFETIRAESACLCLLFALESRDDRQGAGSERETREGKKKRRAREMYRRHRRERAARVPWRVRMFFSMREPVATCV